MARYNKNKPAYCAFLSAALQPIAMLGAIAGAADLALVTQATRALSYAQAWTRDTTEGSRRRLAVETHGLKAAIAANPGTPCALALAGYATALDAFESSDYRRVQVHASAAAKVATDSL